MGCGFKDLLLGKLSIPKEEKAIDEMKYVGKKKSVFIEFYEIAYIKLIY
jgi:hypothetical protein